MDQRRPRDFGSDAENDFVRGPDGQPLRDRFGRPVRRRSGLQPDGNPGAPRHGGRSTAGRFSDERGPRNPGWNRDPKAQGHGQGRDPRDLGQARGPRRPSGKADPSQAGGRHSRPQEDRPRAFGNRSDIRPGRGDAPYSGRPQVRQQGYANERPRYGSAQRDAALAAGAASRNQNPRGEDRPRQYIPSPAERERAARERAARGYREPTPGYRGGSGSRRPGPPRPGASPASIPARRRRRMRLPRFSMPGCGGCLGRMVALMLVAVVLTGLWADTRLNRVDARPPSTVGKTAGTNWLLVGSDSRQGLSDADIERLGTGGDIGVGRTDTVMLLHIPTVGKATLVSLPRDSYVAVPGFGMDKLNAAFTYGGPELLVQTVEQATGVGIDHYAEIGMGGLANTVDAVGGVEVCPPEPISDPLANLDIPAGCQEVEGATALGYVRTRATAQGDLDRVARQREFFSSLLHTMTSPATLLNPLRVVPMIAQVSKSFTVGESDHVWHLARVPLAMRGVQTETVPVGGFADYDVGSVVLWDDAGAEELFGSMR